MAMKKRETLLLVASGLLVLIVAYQLFGSGSGADVLEKQRDKLAQDVENKKSKAMRGQKAAKQMAEWEKRSLPSDHERARSLYQNWLLKLVDKVDMRRARVESAEGRPHRNTYYLLPFTIRGQATIDELIRFLHEFYSAGHLHQIRHLSIKPQDDGKQIEVLISIEALCLPGATRADKLTDEPGKELSRAKLADFRKTIVERKMFSAYSPTPPPKAEPTRTPPPEPPKFDASKYAYLTGITATGPKLQAWFRSRTNNEDFRLSEGDQFQIGPLRGTIVRIGPREVEFEAGGTRYTVVLGTNLHDALAPGSNTSGPPGPTPGPGPGPMLGPGNPAPAIGPGAGPGAGPGPTPPPRS